MVTPWLALLLTLSAASPGRVEYKRAAQLYAEERYEAALPWFEQAYEQSGHRSATIFGLAQCERMLNMWDSAERHLQEFLVTASVKDQVRGRELLAEVRAARQAEAPPQPVLPPPPTPARVVPAPAPAPAKVRPWVPPAPAVVPPAPEPKPESSGSLWSHPVFWVVTGAVVAAGAVTAGVLATRSDPEPFGGTSGTVFRP